MSSLTQEAPALALSDIIHVSPPPSDSSEEHVARIRQRVQEIENEVGKGTVSEMERELMDIALQLTSPSMPRDNAANDLTTIPESSQLLNQAQTIATLISQRDMLIAQGELDRAQWENERAGWDRMAEALISSGAASGSGKVGRRDDADLERQCTAYESDNKSLRDKLTAAQARLTTLEGELSKLRPLLLLDSSSLTSQSEHSAHNLSSPFSIPMTIYGTSPYLNALLRSPLTAGLQTHTTKGKGKEREILTTVPEDGEPTSQAIPINPWSRKLRPHGLRQSKTFNSTFSDARSEHLLLAARRIGRLRTSALSNMAVSRDKSRAELLTGRRAEDNDGALEASQPADTVVATLPQTPKAKGRRPSGVPTSVSPNTHAVMTPTGLSTAVTPTGASPYPPWYGYPYYPQGIYGMPGTGYGIGVVSPGVPGSPTGTRGMSRGTGVNQASALNGRASIGTAGGSDSAAPSVKQPVKDSAPPKQGQTKPSNTDRLRDAPSNGDATPTPLDSLLSAARMMDNDGPTPRRRAPSPTPERASDVQIAARPQRTTRTQKKKQDSGDAQSGAQPPSTTRKRAGAAANKPKGRRNTKQSVPPTNEKPTRAPNTSSTRSRNSKRQAEPAPESRPAKRRRKSDPESEEVTSNSNRIGEVIDVNRRSNSTSSSGARLIASPQFVPVSEDGADPGSPRATSRPIERVRSALDVLADQASVVASESVPRRHSSTALSSSSCASEGSLNSLVDQISARSTSANWVQKEDIDDRNPAGEPRNSGPDDELGHSTRALRSSRVRVPTDKERDRLQDITKKARGKRRRRSSPQRRHLSDKDEVDAEVEDGFGKPGENVSESELPYPGVRIISSPSRDVALVGAAFDSPIATHDTPTSSQIPTTVQIDPMIYAESQDEDPPILTIEVADGQSASDSPGDIIVISPTPAPSATSDDFFGGPKLAPSPKSQPTIDPDSSPDGVESDNCLPSNQVPNPNQPPITISGPCAQQPDDMRRLDVDVNIPVHESSPQPHVLPEDCPPTSSAPFDLTEPPLDVPTATHDNGQITIDSSLSSPDDQITLDADGMGEDAEGDEDAEGELEGDQDGLYEAIPFPMQTDPAKPSPVSYIASPSSHPPYPPPHTIPLPLLITDTFASDPHSERGAASNDSPTSESTK